MTRVKSVKLVILVLQATAAIRVILVKLVKLVILVLQATAAIRIILVKLVKLVILVSCRQRQRQGKIDKN